jgi:hypothetical protein
MRNTSELQARLDDAGGLTELLDVAYEAFAQILTLIREHDDPDSDVFVPMVLAAASAANGRDYVGSAPSLPSAPLPLTWAEEAPISVTAGEWIIGACEALTGALDRAAAAAPVPADRAACAGAAGCAREIFDLMGGRRT